MADDVAARALESLRDVSSGTSSVGDVGEETEIFAVDLDLRRRGMTEMKDQVNPIRGLASRLVLVTTAPVVAHKIWA